jgi:predicted metal-dependent hydrolase
MTRTRTPKRQAPATQKSGPLSDAAPEAEPELRWHDADDLRWAARHWAARLGIKTPIVHIRQMSTKWGSISTAGRLTLNSELLDLHKPLGEFVVVLELVHLLVPNHGRVFKSFLHAYLPDWQQRERELRNLERKAVPGVVRVKPHEG